MLKFIWSRLIPHKWDETTYRRECTLCGRVENLEEYTDPHGPPWIWAEAVRGDRKLHLPRPNSREA